MVLPFCLFEVIFKIKNSPYFLSSLLEYLATLVTIKKAEIPNSDFEFGISIS
jgi:hypothetical protein